MSHVSCNIWVFFFLSQNNEVDDILMKVEDRFCHMQKHREWMLCCEYQQIPRTNSASQYRLPKQLQRPQENVNLHIQSFVLMPHMLPVLSSCFINHLGRNIQECFFFFLHFFGSLSQSSKFPLR